MHNFPIPGKKNKKTRLMIAARAAGKEQYPRRHMHCNRERDPPSREEFMVTIMLPTHIIMKIVEKTKPEDFLEVKLRTLILYYFVYVRS